MQRRHSLGSVLSGLFRTLRPILWSGAKSMGKETLEVLGREALRTGGTILTDITENPQAETKDIISRHVSDSTQKIINTLRGSGARKRKRAMSATRNAKRKRKSKWALPGKGRQRADYKTGYFFIIYVSHGTTMSQNDLAFVSSEFDIYARKPVQHAIHETNVVVYKPIASIDQSDLEFLIPADYDTHVDPDIKIYIRGEFTKADGTALDATDHTASTNNFLHSLFSQCTIALNGMNITLSDGLYNYMAYLETLFSYGVDAAISHLTNSY